MSWRKMIKNSPQCLYFLLIIVKMCWAGDIDEYEYSKMPKLFTLDDYSDCLLEPGGLYCLIDIELKTSTPSDLWYQIKNFSANVLKHYRHDILHKGICLEKTCNVPDANHLKNDTKSTLAVLQDCMSKKLMAEYDFDGDVILNYCEHQDSRPKFGTGDWVYMAIIALIIIVNLAGTLHHLKKEGKNSNRVLMAFSFVANWKKLMSKRIETNDERKASLRGIQGMRFLTMLAVIFAHVVLIIPYGYVGNTTRIEMAYSDPLMQLLYNGSLVVQTFFAIASFLMSYHFLIYIEKHQKPNIRTYILMVVQRWLRLTPIYAIVIGFISTIGEKMGSGPQWRHIVGTEADSCRNYWWANLLYINNYVSESHHCMPQTWYLAADTQLFCYGALVMLIIWRFPKIKVMFFGILMIVAVLVPGIIIFTNRYFPTVRQGPEDFRRLYVGDLTFFNIYITLEGNLGGYTIGLIIGCLQYYMNENNITLRNRKWLFYALYMIVPLGVLEILTGVIFYTDGYVYNPLVAAMYGALYKIVFAVLVSTFILGLIHKCERLMRSVVEWDGFQILGRLSYCAYLLHTIPQRSFVGLIKQPFDVVEYNILSMYIASITLTYFISWPLCIMVEIPFGNLQKILFGEDKESKKSVHDNNLQAAAEIHELNADLPNKTTQNSRL